MPTAHPTARNESYEIKRIETVVAGCLTAFMHQLGGIVDWTPGAWVPANYARLLNADDWRADDQTIWFNRDDHDHRKNEFVQFSDVFYSPDSDFTEGIPKLLPSVELVVDGLSKTFDNSKGTGPVHVAYSESVELSNSVAMSVKEAFTFDVTVKSETTVSGSYAGASLEQKLSAEVHTGFAKEEAKDTAESETNSDSVGIELEVPAGGIEKLDVVKNHERESIPTQGLFIVDFSILMSFYHWWQARAGTKYRPPGSSELKATSVDGLRDLVEGFDTDYPELAGFWEDSQACPSRVRNGINRILDPATRTYYLDADKMRLIEDNVDYRTTTLSSTSGAAAMGTQVVDLSDEQNRDKYAG